MITTEEKSYLALFNGKRGAVRNPQNYQRRDDASHIYHNEEGYSEWWYFDASFTNGYHIVITFHYRNMFLKPMIPTYQVMIYKPDGSKLDAYDASDPKDSSAFPEYCDVKMKDSWARDMGDRYEVHIKIKELGGRLTFRNTVPSWKPGDGYTYFDQEKNLVAGWVVPMPGADVEGEIYFEGQTLKVQGKGYHDHNWGNYRVHETFDKWFWGRISNDKYIFCYGWVLPRDAGKPIISPMLLARDNELILSTDMMQVELSDNAVEEHYSQEYPRVQRISCDTSGIKLNIEMKAKRVIEYLKLPKTTDHRQYNYRFLSDYKMQVDVDGKKDTFEGELLHEFVKL